MKIARLFLHDRLLKNTFEEIIKNHFYYKNIKIFFEPAFNFDDINKGIFKKLNGFLGRLEEIDIKFEFITSIPRCLIRPDNDKIKNYVKNEKKVIFCEIMRGVIKSPGKVDLLICKQLSVAPMCGSCCYHKKNECKGIFLNPKEAERNNFFLNLIKNYKTGKILELGGGTLSFLKAYERLIKEEKSVVYTIDPCNEFNELLKLDILDKYKNFIISALAYAENPPVDIKNLHFDLIISFGSYPLFYDIEKVFQNIKNWLDVGGRVVIIHFEEADIRQDNQHNPDNAKRLFLKHKFNNVVILYKEDHRWIMTATK